MAVPFIQKGSKPWSGQITIKPEVTIKLSLASQLTEQVGPPDEELELEVELEVDEELELEVVVEEPQIGTGEPLAAQVTSSEQEVVFTSGQQIVAPPLKHRMHVPERHVGIPPLEQYGVPVLLQNAWAPEEELEVDEELELEEGEEPEEEELEELDEELEEVRRIPEEEEVQMEG